MKNYITLITVLLFYACQSTPFTIAEYYTIYADDEFGEGHYLMCKLGCDESPKIENIKSIKWNQQKMVIEQVERGKTEWYIIIASGDKLKCCNRDTLIGSIKEDDLGNYISNKEDLIEKIFY